MEVFSISYVVFLSRLFMRICTKDITALGLNEHHNNIRDADYAIRWILFQLSLPKTYDETSGRIYYKHSKKFNTTTWPVEMIILSLNDTIEYACSQPATSHDIGFTLCWKQWNQNVIFVSGGSGRLKTEAVSRQLRLPLTFAW